VIDIIKKHPHHEVIIGIDTLGKEHLLLSISESLKTKVKFEVKPFLFFGIHVYNFILLTSLPYRYGSGQSD
jgi:hypothetical protein